MKLPLLLVLLIGCSKKQGDPPPRLETITNIRFGILTGYCHGSFLVATRISVVRDYTFEEDGLRIAFEGGGEKLFECSTAGHVEKHNEDYFMELRRRNERAIR